MFVRRSLLTLVALSLAGCASPAQNTPEVVTSVVEVTEAAPATEVTETTEAPAAPSAAIVEQCGAVGELAAFTGSSMTSCGFAKAVAKKVQESANQGQFTVDAASPVTGQTYTMRCSATSAETVCTGGNNAIVVVRTATEADKQVLADNTFVGNVMYMTAAELMNGRPTPNGESPNQQYLVLVFDAPTTVKANKTGQGIGSKQLDKIGIHKSAPNWEQYVGKRVRVTVEPSSWWFPSGASIPLGIPSIHDDTKYEVEVL